MKLIKTKIRIFIALLRFLYGWLVYQTTCKTPQTAYSELIFLFCNTQGYFNDAISFFIGLGRKEPFTKEVSGILGKFNQDDFNLKLLELRENGYLLFPSAMSPELCDRLMQFAMSTKAHVRVMDNDQFSRASEPLKYDASNPLAVRYDYDTQDLLNSEDIQGLLADETLLTFAHHYLKKTPKADVLSMWWHTNFKLEPDSEAAQFYHFDMDRIKWLKIFIYLTDVGPNDGPHAFISGSHKSGGIPTQFLDRGYVRLSDNDVQSYYGKSQEVIFTAPRGSVIIEDTRGLHKGTEIKAGGKSRLLLQLQFSNSLFGAQKPTAKLTKITNTTLKSAIANKPSIYQQYT